MCVGARALRARSAALSKVIVRTEQNNFAGGGAVAGLVLRAPVEQMLWAPKTHHDILYRMLRTRQKAAPRRSPETHTPPGRMWFPVVSSILSRPNPAIITTSSSVGEKETKPPTEARRADEDSVEPVNRGQVRIAHNGNHVRHLDVQRYNAVAAYFQFHQSFCLESCKRQRDSNGVQLGDNACQLATIEKGNSCQVC